jgi:cobalt-zinc-cadmium efflux system membrane fusion protein
MEQATSAAIPDLRIREAEGLLREARIRLFNDLQALRNLGLDANREQLVAMPDERRVDFLRFLGLDEKRKEVAAETFTANLLPLRAPFAGEVVQRNVARGESVAPGRPLFVLADLDHVHLELGVEPRDVPRLRIGQTITFVPEGAPRAEASGTLAHIGPEVDEKTRRVWVHGEAHNPTDPARRLRPHTFGDGRVRIAERPHAVVVPAAAVQVEGGVALVFVKVPKAPKESEDSAPGGDAESEGVRFQARTVQTGLRVGDLVEIVRGVAAGEQVVTTGSFALRSKLFSDRIAGED